MQWTTRAALALAALAVVDTLVPAPLAALFLIYVLLAKPPFVKAWVEQLYSGSPSS